MWMQLYKHLHHFNLDSQLLQTTVADAQMIHQLAQHTSSACCARNAYSDIRNQI